MTLAKTPQLAAEEGIGRDLVATIEKRKTVPEAFRPAGRSAEYHWNYFVHVPGESHVLQVGRSLREARTVAACGAATIVEHWHGGKTFKRGPKGGLRDETAPQVCVTHGERYSSHVDAERDARGPMFAHSIVVTEHLDVGRDAPEADWCECGKRLDEPNHGH